ncbi:MAG TPA: DUF4845 domain-containing protein [Steroidobacteraceae bacterium]|nr:DUF4845 domain-containing protein [Steroidobacteraceae bacterium]
MHHKQRGITFIGWLFLLIPVAIVVYAGIRVAPVYLNYIRVARSVEQVAAQFKSDEQPNVQSIRIALDKRFDIEEIEYPKTSDITVKRDNGVWVIEAKYDDTAPLFANLWIGIGFDKVAHIG